MIEVEETLEPWILTFCGSQTPLGIGQKLWTLLPEGWCISTPVLVQIRGLVDLQIRSLHNDIIPADSAAVSAHHHARKPHSMARELGLLGYSASYTSGPCSAVHQSLTSVSWYLTISQQPLPHASGNTVLITLAENWFQTLASLPALLDGLQLRNVLVQDWLWYWGDVSPSSRPRILLDLDLLLPDCFWQQRGAHRWEVGAEDMHCSLDRGPDWKAYSEIPSCCPATLPSPPGQDHRNFSFGSVLRADHFS